MPAIGLKQCDMAFLGDGVDAHKVAMPAIGLKQCDLDYFGGEPQDGRSNACHWAETM